MLLKIDELHSRRRHFKIEIMHFSPGATNASNVKEQQEANLFAPKNIATHPVPALARHGDKDKVTKRDCNKERQLCGSRHHRGRAASKLLIGKDGLDICSVHDNCQNIISALRKRISHHCPVLFVEIPQCS